MSNSNEYMRAYMVRRYSERRAKCVALLGGQCAKCDSSEDLEFDHKDRATKTATVSNLLKGNWELVLRELAKCQLLCLSCHRNKTLLEVEVPHGGGVSGKKNCKCAVCRIRKNEYMKAYKRSRSSVR